MELSDAIQGMIPDDETTGYALGRGCRPETLSNLRIVTWCKTPDPISDSTFTYRYGAFGERLQGMLICPVYNPVGVFLGFEARSTKEKIISDFRLPIAKWNPFFITTKNAFHNVSKGGNAWVVEGLFDLTALDWVIDTSTDGIFSTVTAHLNYQHVMFFKRFCSVGWVNMVYDRDEAGQRGTFGYEDSSGKYHSGALDLLRRQGVRCRDIPYSGGKDPGCLWESGGKQKLVSIFGGKKDGTVHG